MADIVPAPPPPPAGDENRQEILTAFLLWVVLLADIVVAIRIIVRLSVVRIKLWWDDFFIIAAACSVTVGLGLNLEKIHNGFGIHQYYVSSEMLIAHTEYTYIEWVQNFFALMCTKVSICFFLIRIPVHKRYIIPLQVAIVVLIVSNIVLELLWIFQCFPVQAVWDASIEPRYHFSHEVLLEIIFAQAMFSVISDFLFAFYPILLIAHLKLRMKDKVGLCLLMGLGVITGSCCIVRTVLNPTALDPDSTYGTITNWFWRLFEIQFGIICACVPTLIPLYKWCKHSFLSYSSHKTPSSPTPNMHCGPHKRKKEGEITKLLHDTDIERHTNATDTTHLVSGIGPKEKDRSFFFDNTMTTASGSGVEDSRAAPEDEAEKGIFGRSDSTLRDERENGFGFGTPTPRAEHPRPEQPRAEQPNGGIRKTMTVDVDVEKGHTAEENEAWRLQQALPPPSQVHMRTGREQQRETVRALPPLPPPSRDGAASVTVVMEPKPSLEIDLRPSFDDNREVFEGILEGEGEEGVVHHGIRV